MHVCVQDTRELRRDLQAQYPQLSPEHWAQAGWQFHKTLDASGDKVRLREKPLPRGWVLRFVGGAGYELKEIRSGHVRPFPTWDWAELDGKRLVWAEKGCLFAATLDRELGIGTPTLVHDFNDMKFETRPAPY